MKIYLVEVINELVLEKEHWNVDALSAQEAVDLVKEKYDNMENYFISNVFVESEEVWQ